MTVLTAETIDELDATLWNRAAVDQAAARYELNSVLDAEMLGARPRRYYAYAGGAGYLGVARITELLPERGRPAPSPVTYGRAARLLAALGLDIGPSVVCGWRVRRADNLALAAGAPPAERLEIMHALCTAIEADARGKAVVFANVLAGDDELRGVLARRGYVAAGALPIAFLDVRWHDLEGYVATLRRASKRWAKAARLEINRQRRCGDTIGRTTAGPVAPADAERIAELVNAHYERLNGRTLGFTPAVLERLSERLGDDCLVYVVRRRGRVTGVCAGLRSGSDAALAWVGLEPAPSREGFTYFNLVFYAPAADYAAFGVRRVCLGNAAYGAKLRRGCRIVASEVYVRAPGAVSRAVQRPVLELQRRLHARKFRAFLGASGR